MPLECVWPRPLKPGGIIGICSPAGVSPAEQLGAGVAALIARGYRVKVAPHATAVHPELAYLAGLEEQRANDLNSLLRDPDVDLILCSRGGYGAMKILDRIDYDAARRDPKPLVGYSDITALSLALAARADIVSFSGIMATDGHGFRSENIDAYSEASFWHSIGESPFPRVMGRAPDAAPWEILRGPEIISGPLVPVCFSLLTALLGTPFVPDLTGAILVIEDVHEELYAVDRFLTQMRLTGILDNLAGLLIGSFNGVSDEENETLRVMVPRLASEMTPSHVPVASGVAYGHIHRRLTLPVGAQATVDLAAGTFTFDNP